MSSSIFNQFNPTEHAGNHPSEFYFKYTANGRKMYYSWKNHEPLNKNRIPKNIIDEIKEAPKELSDYFFVEKKHKLLEQKQSKIKQMEMLQKKLVEIDKELKEIESMNIDEEKVSINIKKRQKQASDRFHHDYADFFEKIFKDYNHQNFKKHKTEPKKDNINGLDFLHSLAIFNKHDWKQWLLKNHPDKGGKDIALVQKVIEYGQNVFD